MFKTLMMIAATTMAFSGPAMAEEKVSSETSHKTTVEKDASGNYKAKSTSSEEATDATGTKSSLETKTTVKSDTSGNSETVKKTTAVVDPKGLGNKSKTVVTDSEKHKDDGSVETSYQKKVNGKVVEETTDTAKPN